MSTLKDVSIIVKWNGKEFPITDLSDQETVAVLKHEIAKLTNVRPERQKLLNLKYKGNNGLTQNQRFFSHAFQMNSFVCTFFHRCCCSR